MESIRKNLASVESLPSLAAGFSGGVISTSLLLPLDVIKVRMQVNEAPGCKNNLGLSRNIGFNRILRGIIRHEGIVGVYQGWTPAVIGSAVSWGGYFFFYDSFKKILTEHKQQRIAATEVPTTEASTQERIVLSSSENFTLACSAGGVMVFLTNPIWLIKTRMQLQMKNASIQHNVKPYSSIFDAVRTIIREEGIMALYKGTGAALLLTSHGGVQFMVYEYLKEHFQFSRVQRNRDSNTTVLQRLEDSLGFLSMGAVSKIAASTVTYPLQVIKARIQQRSDALEITREGDVRAVKRDYSGITTTIRRIVEREGVLGLFKGCLPNAIRVAPGSAITFVVYESVMDWFDT